MVVFAGVVVTVGAVELHPAYAINIANTKYMRGEGVFLDDSDIVAIL